jgi:hypothetical protein
MLQGWGWYAGSNTSQIGANQYDFETTVLHELGHALGLGGTTDRSSPMYEVLAAGVADRTTTPDPNIPDPPAGADPQMAAGFRPGPTAGLSAPAAAVASAAVLGPGPVLGSQLSVLSPHQWSPAGGPRGSQVGPETTLVVQVVDREDARQFSLTGPDADHVLDSVLAELVTDADRWRDGAGGGTDEVLPLPDAGDARDGSGPVAIRSKEARPDPVSRPMEIPHVDDGLIGTRLRAVPVSNATLDEPAAVVGWSAWMTIERGTPTVPRPPDVPKAAATAARSGERDGRRDTDRPLAGLAAALLASGFWSQRGRTRRTRNSGRSPRM